MRLNKMCLSGLFGLAIAATACGAVTTVVSQPFATETSDITAAAVSGSGIGYWSGNGSVTNIAATQSISVGKPVTDTGVGVLAVEGKVLCQGSAEGASLTSGSMPTSVDMLIQIAKPDDALEALDDANVKFAIGVESDGTIKAYCGPKSGSGAAWRTLIGTAQTEGSWHRVSLRFDYENGVCEVAFDGDPVVSEFGWLTSAKGNTTGAWYPLVTSATGLASVQVVGTTAIDDVLVQSGTMAEVAPQVAGDVTKGGTAIPRTWFVANGVSSATDNAPDGSNMTIKDKYLTGVSPTSGETFAVKSMTMTGAAGSVKANLTVPAMTPPAGYKNVVKYGSAPNSLDSSADIAAGTTSVQLAVSKADSGVTVLYYQIQTVPTVAQ